MTGILGTGLYLGTDVQAEMERWWNEEFLPGFYQKYRQKYGADVGISVLLLHQRVRWDMFHPQNHVALWLTTDVKRATAQQGWNDNVFGKWMVLAHTGAERSNYIVTRPWLLEAGMFPHDGAGWVTGIPGGASGLPTGAEDFEEFSQVAEHYILTREAATVPALAAAADKREPRTMKYLNDPNWRPQVSGEPFQWPSPAHGANVHPRAGG